jgi:large subunit ribosomal protein L25
MVANATLSASTRTDLGKSAVRKLRAAGKIPAVVYGHGEETQSVSIDAHEIELLFSRISVESTMITLKIEGRKGADLRTLVREVQKHPVKANVLHVDFYQLHAGEKVTVHTPIRLLGTAAGQREGGILNQSLDTLDVRCLPDNIPSVIEIDISGLHIGDSIHVRDLPLPEGVESEIDGDITVAAVSHPSAVEAVVAAVEAPEAATSEPELVRKRPEKEEEK